MHSYIPYLFIYLFIHLFIYLFKKKKKSKFALDIVCEGQLKTFWKLRLWNISLLLVRLPLLVHVVFDNSQYLKYCKLELNSINLQKDIHTQMKYSLNLYKH